MFCIYTYILTHGLNCNLFHEQLQTKLKQNSDKDLNLNTLSMLESKLSVQ